MAGAGTSSANDRHLDQVTISIHERFRGLSLPSDCYIFTVPETVRRINEEAYTPRAVAIGPYHRHKPSLEPMEDHKLLYLRTFLQARDLTMEVHRRMEVDDRLKRHHQELDRLEHFHRLEVLDRLEQSNRVVHRRRREDDRVILCDHLLDDRPFRLDQLEDDQVVQLEGYIQLVKSREKDTRSCYDKEIDLDSDRFAEMMLLDGIFMIQIFLMSQYTGTRLPGDRIFGRPWILKDVCRDMTLLENQIPFFVINDLFTRAFSGKNWYQPTLLLELMYKFFSRHTQVEELPEERRPKEVKHIVDALRLSFLPSMDAEPPWDELIKFNPRATELVAARVKLTRSESKCLFDIEFENGELKIPHLVLYDGTESLFRNIIAFEQCYYQNASNRNESNCSASNKNLISYMAFMDHLVDTPADTELLMDNGIIENWLGTKEAPTDLINAFCKETTMLRSEYYFRGLSYKLVEHCRRPFNKSKATLKREYCSNPWVVISVIAAVVLLLLTVVQTACSVLSIV